MSLFNTLPYFVHVLIFLFPFSDLFAFDLYDSDSSGQLSPDEVQRMLKDIYGSDHKTNFRAKA